MLSHHAIFNKIVFLEQTVTTFQYQTTSIKLASLLHLDAAKLESCFLYVFAIFA